MAGLYHGHVLEFPRIRVDCFTTGTASRFIPFPLTREGVSGTRGEETTRKHHKLERDLAFGDRGVGHSNPGYYTPPAAQYHILTHAHTDHLIGLSSIASSSASGSNITIICSDETKALVLAYETKNARTSFDRETQQDDDGPGNDQFNEDKQYKGVIKMEYESESSEYPVFERKRRPPPDIRLPRKRPKKLYEGLGPRTLEVVTRSGERQKAWLNCFRTIPYNTVIPLCIPVNHPLTGQDDSTGRISTTATTTVNLVMLDANHCPGSSMFLIYSGDSAVLHTGDVRADSVFMAGLKRNPLIQPFLAKSGRTGRATATRTTRRLDRIYLDTSAFIGTTDMLTKERCIDDLIELIRAYPVDWTFHFNCWTFGYEDVLKAVSREFDTLVHLDRWRHDNFQRLRGDPMLHTLGTRFEYGSRFHACEKGAPCLAIIEAANKGKLVVVNFVEEKMVEHEIKMKVIRGEIQGARAGLCEWPIVLYCPLARHSTLPELQSLVNLFRPRSLSPNTLTPGYDGYDYYAMVEAFRGCLDEDAYRNIEIECLDWFRYVRGVDLSMDDLRRAYKLAFGLSITEEMVRDTNSLQGSSQGQREKKRTRDRLALQRTRRANVYNQMAAFSIDENSMYSQYAQIVPSRSCSGLAPTVNVCNGAAAKQELDDEKNVHSSRCPHEQGRSRAADSHDSVVDDRNLRREIGVDTDVKAQSSNTAFPIQLTPPNVRMKLRYGNHPAM